MNYFLGYLFSWFEKLIMFIFNLFFIFLRKWKCPASLFCIFKRERFFSSSSSSFYVKFEKYIYVHTLRCEHWRNVTISWIRATHMFLILFKTYFALKNDAAFMAGWTKILLLYDSFGTIFDSWWSGYFDIYPLFKRFPKEKGKHSWYRFPSFFW